MASLRSVSTTFGLNSAKYRSELKRAQSTTGEFRSKTQRYLKDTQRSFSNTSRSARSMDSAFSSSFRNAASAVAVLDGPLGGVAGRMTSLGSVVGKTGLIFGAAGIAIAGMATVMGKALKVGQEYERQQLRTEQLIKATGYSAGLTATQLEAQARALALNTLASTEQVRDAQAVLLTFRSVSGETFSRTIKLAQGLSVVFGDMKSATLQLGKALEDPATGLTALKRSGVSFTDAEREMITAMHDAGRAAEAQRLILDKLQGQIGDSGVAEAGGLTGSVDTLTQRWDEFLAALYKSANAGTVAGGFLSTLSSSLNGYARNLQITRVLEESLTDEAAKRAANASQFVEPYKLAMAQVSKAYRDAQAKIAAMEASPFKNNRGMKASLKQQRKIAEESYKQYNRIFERYVKQPAIEARKAEEKGEEAKRQRDLQRLQDTERKQKEQAAKQLARRQQESSALVSSLEMRLATKEDKINLSHEREVEKIRQLTLSEQQIRAAGYNTLEALQADYIARSETARDQSLEKLRAKNNGNNPGGASGDLEKLRQKYAGEEALLLEKTFNEQEILINAEAARLISEQESQQLRQQSWQAYYDAVSKSAEDAADKQAQAQARANEKVAQMQGQIAQQSVSLIKSTAEEGSAVWMAALAMEKGIAIAQALINSEVAATRALAELGPIAGPPMAATMRTMGYASAGLIAAQAVTEISGARADGGQVLSGHTYLVGERGPELFTAGATGQVTSHENLQQAVNGRQAANAPTIIINEAPPGTTASYDPESDVTTVMMGKMKEELIHDLDSGGEVRTKMESTWPLNAGAMV